jgi:hypothetical protein
MRNRRIVVAVIAGSAVAVVQASREYVRLREVIGSSPHLASQLRNEFVGVWFLLLLVSGTASFLVVFLFSRASGSRFVPLFALAIVALLFGAMLPLYWYRYRAIPEASHISIPLVERYTPTLSAITALVAYGLAGFLRQNGRRSDANAA